MIGVNLSDNWMAPFCFSALQDTECKYVESVQWQWLAGGDGGGNGSKEKVYLPIIEIDTSSASEVDQIVSSLAAGDIIIPKVSILPTKLSCRIISISSHSNVKETFDLVLQFELKMTSSTNPDEWANWSLQFLHNQLHDSFAAIGAQEMNHPFQVTLACGIVWKTDET